MKLQTVKNELWLIAKAYPTLAGLMQKALPGGKTVGHHWAELLKDLDATHFSNVCYAYAMLETPLPDPIDQLPFHIRSEVRDLVARDQAKLQQYQQVHSRKKFESRSNDPYYKWSHWLIANGPLEQDKLDELVNWCVWDKPKPQWIDDNDLATVDS